MCKLCCRLGLGQDKTAGKKGREGEREEVVGRKGIKDEGGKISGVCHEWECREALGEKRGPFLKGFP